MAQQLPESARRLIDGTNIAHVATLMRDGSPQVTPVWVDRDGDTILINTAHGRLKARNVRRDPRVAVSLVDRDRPNPPLLIRGRVVQIIEGAAAWEHFKRIQLKYSGNRDPQPHPGDTRIVWRIEVEQIRAPEAAPQSRPPS